MSIENYGSYQLLKRLATGGMAQIYLARRRGSERPDELLVVKRILPHLAENDDFIKMFLDEARIAARLAHPNIVQIFDLGAQDDSFFIAMEYIHGEDVRRVWKRSVEEDKPLPVPLACRIIAEAAAGLDYAHKKPDAAGNPLGIVHRDVSPQNILVTFEGGAKVVDFGIAKAADQATVTRSGVLKGKYSYMSPEQAAGQRVDCRADVFALGVVLYELLTGVRLFKRRTDMQTLKAVSECQIAPPSELSERVPKSLDAIILKALAKDPDTRYGEALQLQLALEEWLSANRQPASAAHLSAFMKEIFSERLSEEARLGEVVPSETPPPTGMRSALVPPPAPRRTGAHASVARKQTPPPTTPRPGRNLEVRRPTQADTERPPSRRTGTTGAVRRASKPALVPLDVAPPQAEPEASSARTWWVAGLVAVTSALVVGGGLWTLLRPSAPVAAPAPAPVSQAEAAKVRLVTEPPGATVVFNGGALAEVTPLTLPPVPAGRYPVVVALDGHREQQLVVDIPASGAVALEPLRLERLVPAAAPEPAPAPAQAPLPEAAEPVVNRPPPEPRPVRARPVEPRPEPPRAEPRPVPETRKALVRFAVTPWAEVSCGGHTLGTTPFPDVPLPVGVYECRFHNPELARTKTQRVEVKASGPNTVVVKF